MIDNEGLTSRPESSSHNILIEPRNFPIELERQNRQFNLTVDQIASLIATGNLGDFYLADDEFNVIEPELGFSRKIAIQSPSNPDYLFIVTGLGIVTANDSGDINIAPPSVNETVHQKFPDLATNLLTTRFIDEQGNLTGYPPDESNVGAYYRGDGMEKYDNTQQIKQKLEGKVSVIIPIAAGFLDAEHSSSFFAYAIPKKSTTMEVIKNNDISMLAKVEGIDNTNIVKYIHSFKLVTATEKAFRALRALNEEEILQMQFHPANMYPQRDTNGDIEDVMISDFETHIDVTSYSRESSQGELSIHDKAVLYQLQQAVLVNSIVKDNNPTPESFFITTLLTRTLAGRAIAAYSPELSYKEVVSELQSRFNALPQEFLFSMISEQQSPYQSIIMDLLEEYAHGGKLLAKK